jgi:hypothetical protein
LNSWYYAKGFTAAPFSVDSNELDRHLPPVDETIQVAAGTGSLSFPDVTLA